MPHDPLLLTVATPFRANFYPLGQEVVVESNDPRPVDAARAKYGRFPPIAPAPQGRPTRLRLLLDPKMDSHPPWPKPYYRGGGDLLIQVCSSNVAVTDLKKKFTAGFFSEAMLADQHFFSYHFLPAAVYMPMEDTFTPLHAACVVRDGRGICLCGDSGAGKTTLAYYCARHGYQVLAENFVALTRATPLRLRGDPTYFHFTADSPQLFPELVQWPKSLGHDGLECLVVSSEDLGIASLYGECTPAAVLFLHRGEDSGLEKVPARRALDMMYEAKAITGDARTMTAHRAVYRRLVKCGVYRLKYRSLQEALELLDRL